MSNGNPMRPGDVVRVTAADGTVCGIFEKCEGRFYRVRVAGIALLFPIRPSSRTTEKLQDGSVVHTVLWARSLASAAMATGD